MPLASMMVFMMGTTAPTIGYEAMNVFGNYLFSITRTAPNNIYSP